MAKKYKHILVPLDSSELAELALEDALGVAELSHAEITLLHVISPLDSILAADTGHPIFIDQQWESHKINALSYLKKICARLDCRNIKIHTAVEMGLPAETIIEYAHRHPVDLIVMGTHGRSGLQRWVYGSVADKVLRGADTPVLLVRSHGPKERA